MADYKPLNELSNYPALLKIGLEQHRSIDSFTDSHQEFKKLQTLLVQEGAPRFSSGILIDIFWDYCLAKNWQNSVKPYLNFSHEAFCTMVYTEIQKNQHWHSPLFVRVFPYIQSQNWLFHYASLEGIRQSLYGLSQRLAHGRLLAGCERYLEKYEATFEKAFLAFWPDLLSNKAEITKSSEGETST